MAAEARPECSRSVGLSRWHVWRLVYYGVGLAVDGLCEQLLRRWRLARVGTGVPHGWYRFSADLELAGSCRWRFPASSLCVCGRAYSQQPAVAMASWLRISLSSRLVRDRLMNEIWRLFQGNPVDRYGLAITKSGVPCESLSAPGSPLSGAGLSGVRVWYSCTQLAVPGKSSRFMTKRSAYDFGLCSRFKGKRHACTGTRVGDERRSGGRRWIRVPGFRPAVPSALGVAERHVDLVRDGRAELHRP